MITAASAGSTTTPIPASRDPQLQSSVEAALRHTVEQSAARKLEPDHLAVTAIDLTDPAAPRQAGHRGGIPIYPASVVKLFYLAAAHQWLEDGRLRDTPELQRALRDMIVDSSNDATHYVVDMLTGTTSGPELAPADLAHWHDQRNAVNRHFAALGYAGINVNQKPWSEGPYGRDAQAIHASKPSRNLLTTDATAQLLGDIATGRAVTAERSAQMMELLLRLPPGAAGQQGEIEWQLIGPALLPGARLWSKGGWTRDVRHNAAYLELPDGRKLILVLFSERHAGERGILHALAQQLMSHE